MMCGVWGNHGAGSGHGWTIHPHTITSAARRASPAGSVPVGPGPPSNSCGTVDRQAKALPRANTGSTSTCVSVASAREAGVPTSSGPLTTNERAR